MADGYSFDPDDPSSWPRKLPQIVVTPGTPLEPPSTDADGVDDWIPWHQVIDALLPNDWQPAVPPAAPSTGPDLRSPNPSRVPFANAATPPARRPSIGFPLPPPETAWQPPIFLKDYLAAQAADAASVPSWLRDAPGNAPAPGSGPAASPPWDISHTLLYGITKLPGAQSNSSPFSQPVASLGLIPGPKDLPAKGAAPSPATDVFTRPIGSDPLAPADDPALRDLIGSGWARAKTGALVAPPPPLMGAPLVAAFGKAAGQVLAPNVTRALTALPPTLPAHVPTSGKLPRAEDPYVAALIDFLTLAGGPEDGVAADAFGPLARWGARIPSRLEIKGLEDAAGGGSAAAKELPPGAGSTAERTARPYGELKRTLEPGWQAHHLNEVAAYREFIPHDKGLSIPMRGDAFTEPGSPHYVYHQRMGVFWKQYRAKPSFIGPMPMPTNAQYGQASYRALVDAGILPDQAAKLVSEAAAQRMEKGLLETDSVPRIPGARNPSE